MVAVLLWLSTNFKFFGSVPLFLLIFAMPDEVVTVTLNVLNTPARNVVAAGLVKTGLASVVNGASDTAHVNQKANRPIQFGFGISFIPVFIDFGKVQRIVAPPK